MSFSSIAAMLSAAQVSGQPLYAVIRDADCQENGYDAAASHRQIAALWAARTPRSPRFTALTRSAAPVALPPANLSAVWSG